ncbi:MAG TPA: acyl-CoA dehydrogenase family protein [Steroidobacteraceae bacterium]|jgi:alkylation response protein AidB-like acyl-CoA dehydrogenase|nr:acyl-CoA dehydrogenase family protein [Steroidobacteraceae bacterium]
MRLEFTDEEQAFREEVRRFLREQLSSDISDKVLNGYELGREDHVVWQRRLHERGWGGVGWPVEFGGPGWNSVQQYIFEEESALAGAPRLIPFGTKMVGPVIMAFGSPAQQQRFLPKISSGAEWWCQGYSEPGAGSDLASLKTRAVCDGDHYVVDGQKTWNTLGQYADWIFCLVRTDSHAKQQSGITFLLIDMKSPGITVRPIMLLDGGHEVNEIWFENVRVPVENRIGEENRGWTYAKFLLGHERNNIAGIGIAKRELARLKRIAAREHQRGRPLLEDPLFAAQIAQVEVDLWALEITNLRVLSAERQSPATGPEASILKVRGTEIHQSISELLMRAVGPYALPLRREAMEAGWQFDPTRESPGPRYASTLAASYFNQRKLSIFGGTNEIQKNIISKMIVGL